jgi:hemin uptake protein HemP
MTRITLIPMPAIHPHPPAAPHSPAASTCPSAANGPGSPPHWHSRQLFGPHAEVSIAHGDAVYRLRVTSLGKLILTK